MIPRLIPFAALILIFGCSDPDPGGPVGPVSTTGTFAVDAMTVNAWLQADSVTGASAGRFGYSLRYHFEGYPGTIDTIQFTINQTRMLMLLFHQEVPDSLGKGYSHSPVYGMGNLLGNSDSIVVTCEFMGRFWKTVDASAFDKYKWTQTMKIPLQRR